MKNYFLGIDGGGTHCRARLVNESGEILGEASSGTANTTSGVGNAYVSILKAAKKILDSAELDLAVLKHTWAGFGLAGLVDSEEIRKIEQFDHPFASVTAHSDGVAACLGAHEGKDGGIAIFGTGSSCFAFHEGESINIGGWGFLLSDHGSGARLGLQSIRRAMLAADNILPHSPFTQAVLERFDNLPGNAVRWTFESKPKDYGEFAKIAVHFAGQRDQVAHQLIAESAKDAEMLIAALIEKGITKIALLGGLSPYLKDHFPDEMQDCFCQPLGDAMDGALHMARSAYLNRK